MGHRACLNTVYVYNIYICPCLDSNPELSSPQYSYIYYAVLVLYCNMCPSERQVTGNNLVVMAAAVVVVVTDKYSNSFISFIDSAVLNSARSTKHKITDDTTIRNSVLHSLSGHTIAGLYAVTFGLADSNLV